MGHYLFIYRIIIWCVQCLNVYTRIKTQTKWYRINKRRKFEHNTIFELRRVCHLRSVVHLNTAFYSNNNRICNEFGGEKLWRKLWIRNPMCIKQYLCVAERYLLAGTRGTSRTNNSDNKTPHAHKQYEIRIKHDFCVFIKLSKIELILILSSHMYCLCAQSHKSHHIARNNKAKQKKTTRTMS